jgi:fucose permease
MDGRAKVAGTILSIAGFSISANSLPPLLTGLARRYEVDPWMFGMAFFLQYALFTAFSLLSGRLSGRSRVTPEIILVAGMILTGLVLPFIGAVPNFPAFLLFMALIGGCGGLVESNGTGILSTLGGGDQGRSIHVSQLFYCIGAILAPLVIGMLQARGVADALIGLAVGLLALGIAIAVYGLMGIRPGKANSGSEAGRESTGKSPDEGAEVPQTRTFPWFVAAMILYVMIEVTLASWLPIYMENRYLMHPSRAAFQLTLFWVGVAAGRSIYVFLPVASPTPRLGIHGAGILASVLILVLFQGLPLVTTTAVFLLGCSCGPIWPLLVILCGTRHRAKRFVFYLVAAGSFGAILGIFCTSTVLGFLGTGSIMAVTGLYAFLFIAALAGLTLALARQQHGSRRATAEAAPDPTGH